MSFDEDTQNLGDRLVVERTWPETIKLKHPVEFGSKTIEALTFRRGRIGDLKGVKLDGIPPVDQIIVIASRMCGEPTGVIDRLDGEDATAVMEIALSFFAKCLGAGAKP